MKTILKTKFDKLPTWGKTATACFSLQALFFLVFWSQFVQPEPLALFGQFLKAEVLRVVDPRHVMSFSVYGVRHLMNAAAFLDSEYPAEALRLMWVNLKFPLAMSLFAWFFAGRFVYSHFAKTATIPHRTRTPATT